MRPSLPLVFCFTIALSGAQSFAEESTCYCRDSDGNRVAFGEMRCLTVGGRSFTALCDMSLNTMTWREQYDGCVSS